MAPVHRYVEFSYGHVVLLPSLGAYGITTLPKYPPTILSSLHQLRPANSIDYKPHYHHRSYCCQDLLSALPKCSSNLPIHVMAADRRRCAGNVGR